MLDHALACLATTIYMESAHQPKQAQIAVGYVVMRRADFKPKNVCYEVKKPYQFSWYGVKTPPIIQQYYFDLAYRILHRIEVDYSHGATNFHDTSIENPWPQLQLTAKWSQLIFYKPREKKYG
jgi:hypothetical protein